MSNSRVDNSINICIDSSDKHCRRSSLECASSIGVYTSTHRAGRWTEGEDFLLTAESEDEVDEKSGLKLLMIIRCGETINA